jgi:hypothetical protein
MKEIDMPILRSKTGLVLIGLLIVIGLAGCQGFGEGFGQGFGERYMACARTRGDAVDAAIGKCRALGKHYEYIDESIPTKPGERCLGKIQVKFRCVSG